MHKFTTLLCVLLAALLSLCACGRGVTIATDRLAELLSTAGLSPPDANVYFAGGSDEQRLDGIIERLYGTTTDTLHLLADYAVLLGRGTDLYEIHILRVGSLSDVPVVRRLLETRANAICLAVEEGHTITRAAVVCVDGATLYLFATPRNAALQEAAGFSV